LEIMEKGYPVVVALNMWDVAKNGNVKINAPKLEQILGVPVVPTVATRGEGLKELVLRIKNATSASIEEVMEKVGGKGGTFN